MCLQESPAGERAELLQPVAGVVVDAFQIGGALAESEQVQATAESDGPKLNRQAAADQAGGRAGPANRSVNLPRVQAWR